MWPGAAALGKKKAEKKTGNVPFEGKERRLYN